jgi:hypothetical protein
MDAGRMKHDDFVNTAREYDNANLELKKQKAS